MTQRIGPSFKKWLTEIEKNHKIRLKNTTQRIGLVFENGSQNWTCFSALIKEMNLFFEKKPKELDIFLTCLEELNLFSEMTLRIGPVSWCGAGNWAFVLLWLKRIEHSWKPFWTCTMIWTSFSIWLEEIETFFSMTQRIKLLFFWIWFTELNRFLRFDSKNWIWFTELNPFLKYDSKNWIWLKGLTFFFLKYDSKNWLFFWKFWLKELNS